MRVSQYLLSTLRDRPSNTEIVSHELMLRSGMIRQLASGLYTWLPTGLRILRKIENIIRKEMNHLGAIEISMPMMQPASLWKKSGRLEQYGSELFCCFDRSRRPFVFAPTHEEVITNLMRHEINSYKQLPLHFFQIQTKFRDEIRPRFGIMRSREFLMKDSYSFHTSQESLQETYNQMRIVYSNIFTRIGLNFCIVQGNTESIGGNISHEFQVIAKSGEGNLIFSDTSNYVENIEFSEALAPSISLEKATEEMRLVETPNVKNITDLVKQFNLPIKKITKTILIKAKKEVNKFPLIAVVIRGDHDLNKTKVEKLPQVSSPLAFANESEIRTIVNANPVFLGPINMPVPILIDRSVAVMNDFAAGANIEGKYYFGINWNRDVAIPEIADIRNVVPGDPSPDGKGSLVIKHGIEVGHIFQLGMKYSRIMNTIVQNKIGNHHLIMGCYGIGITRTVAAIIEQNHDERGIIWPENIAPFQVAVLPINIHKSYKVREVSEKLYSDMSTLGIEVLIDDRKEYPGIMFTDMELIGIPHIIVISDRTLNHNKIEYNYRRNHRKKLIKVNEVINFLSKSIGT